MSMTLEQFGLDRLNAEERIELMGLIWDSLDRKPYQPPAWHQKVLEERLRDETASDPSKLIPLEEVKAKLLNQP